MVATGRVRQPTYDCLHPTTGLPVRHQYPKDEEYPLSIRRITGGDVPFDTEGSEAFPLEPTRVRNIGRKFGVSFTLDGVQTERTERRWIYGTFDDLKEVRYHLAFTLCPNGGLDVKGC